MLAEGQSVKEIATGFDLSVKTVEAHKFNLMRKLDIHNKAQLVQYAIQKKVIRLPELVDGVTLRGRDCHACVTLTRARTTRNILVFIALSLLVPRSASSFRVRRNRRCATVEDQVKRLAALTGVMLMAAAEAMAQDKRRRRGGSWSAFPTASWRFSKTTAW